MRTVETESRTRYERVEDGSGLVDSEGDAERLRVGHAASEDVQDGFVLRFDVHDGNDQGEDARVIDDADRTEVRADGGDLDDSGASHHGFDIDEQSRRVKCAIMRRPAECIEGFLDDGDIGRLVGSDGLDGGEGVPFETGTAEVGFGELSQPVLVELRLHFLEDERKGF